MRLIKWGCGAIDATQRVKGLKLDYCPFLLDPLDWGPQHVDLATQDGLRQAFFRYADTDTAELESYTRALDSGDEVALWCDPILGSCLAILWLLDGLVARHAPLGSAYLVLAPGRPNSQARTEDAVRHAFAERIPAADILQPLITIRRHLASDSGDVRADLSELPSPVREWAAVTDQLEDFLPDQRGLDILDSMLLDKLVEESDHPRAVWGDYWPTAALVLGIDQTPKGHYFSSDRVWNRLAELSGIFPPMRAAEVDPRRLPVQAWFDGEATYGRTHFHITHLGRRVRNGTADFLPQWPFARWVGGRLISSERPRRRLLGRTT